MISIDDVRVEKAGRLVLDGLTLDLSERRIGVIGQNGSGKSTFARLLNGLERPTGGRVAVDGADTVRDARRVRRRVGFVFQDPDNQIVYPTVREDIAFGLRNLRVDKAEIDRLVDAELARNGLSHLHDRLTHELSGGEKQMIALIGVMIMRPSHVVLDEPTTLLDLANKARIMGTIARMEQSVVMVSHDLDLLRDFDRILCFHRGRLHADGAPDDVIGTYIELCRCS